jgi:hypothetical protein
VDDGQPYCKSAAYASLQAGMDDTTLCRREFLARTAAAAGLAGLGSLPGGTLIAEAARAM